MAEAPKLDIFDQKLAVTPPLDDAQLSAVPAKRGVVLLAAADAPIQLMTAGDIRSRVATRLAQPADDARRRTADLRQITTSLAWTLTYSPFQTDLVYLRAAARLYPSSYGEQLAWKCPRFVCVDPADQYPVLRETRAAQPASGVCLGPMPSHKAAQRFIDTLQDAFDLCRHERCLRAAPHGQSCAYAQMNRCLKVCCGGVSLDEYRSVVARAAAYAAGDRAGYRAELETRMKHSAAAQEFERAAAVKARLSRLAELDGPQYDQVATLEAFRFVLVQRGRSTSKPMAFCVNWGQCQAAELEYPPSEQHLTSLLADMASARMPAQITPLEQWTMGLVASYLLCAESKAGVIVRYGPELSAQALAQRIEASADLLKLRKPKGRKSEDGKTS